MSEVEIESWTIAFPLTHGPNSSDLERIRRGK